MVWLIAALVLAFPLAAFGGWCLWILYRWVKDGWLL